MGAVLTVTDDTFQAEVLDSSVPVLVEFWAIWCGPCRGMVPILDRVAGERAGAMKVVKVDTDANPVTALKYQILQVPTMLVIAGGQVVGEMRGRALPKPLLDRELDAALVA